jgi:hypothetical protein
MKCRHCGATLIYTFLDLGYAPPSNAYLTQSDLKKVEKHYPLHIKVCDQCWLVQTEDYTGANELFSHDYAYFSSTSSGWLDHAKNYSEKIIKELDLTDKSMVYEIASNDGYLLKNFVAAGIPCMGIEPTESTATAAEQLGIPVLREFFSYELSGQIIKTELQADLIIGNNVYAHVPDINDFTQGMKILLKPGGTITLEFPHLMRLVEKAQFDTVYHEHFSYLSLQTIITIFNKYGLRVWHVEEIDTHGGSLRIYGCHENDERINLNSVSTLINEEINKGLKKIQTYLNFQYRANKIKNDFIYFLLKQKQAGKKVAAYGAAAKGNTLLNYAGIKQDLIEFVCDAAKSKQGKYLPGSHLPIYDPEKVNWADIDFVIIFPWNLISEIKAQLKPHLEQHTLFVTAVPFLSMEL